jgi:chemotaxis protein methyltransferase CheR
LADRGELAQAIRVAEAALAKNPAAAELNHVRAITLLAAGLVAEAVDALRRIIYLDPSAAVAHFLMAVSLERLGDLSGAFRAFGRVDALCSASPPDEVIAYGDGETAARLAAIARANVVRLQMTGNRSDG